MTGLGFVFIALGIIIFISIALNTFENVATLLLGYDPIPASTVTEAT